MEYKATNEKQFIPMERRGTMSDTTTHCRCRNQQASTQPASELSSTAENELAAFYHAVLNQYGAAEAGKAAQDWIEAVENMQLPADGSKPGWRQITITAASRLASRVLSRPSIA